MRLEEHQHGIYIRHFYLSLDENMCSDAHVWASSLEMMRLLQAEYLVSEQNATIKRGYNSVFCIFFL